MTTGDVATVTLMQCDDKYGINGEFYNEGSNQIEISYDVFASKYFINVPDLKEVNLPNILYCQAEGNVFCHPLGEIGSASLVTDVIVEMGTAAVAPKKVLTAAKGKEVGVMLKMDISGW